jgi:hypothetical protein
MRTATAKRSTTFVIVIGLTVGVAVFTHSQVAHQGAVGACNADAEAVETAVATFKAQNPSTTPTPTRLITSTVNGRPLLKSWPHNGSLFSVFLSSTGTVKVSVPATAKAVSYDAANPCASVA